MSSGASETLAAGYAAVRDGGAGLIDLSSRGRILVSGADAVMFLNGLLTNDVKTLPRAAWLPAAFANVQGRLLAEVRVFHREDGFLLDTNQSTREKVLQLLDRFTLAGDFRVADLTREITTVSVQGAGARDLIQAVLGHDAAAVQRGHIAAVELDGARIMVIAATHTGEMGFDLFGDSDAVSRLRAALVAAGAVPADEQTYDTLRIEGGIARYGVDMDEGTLVSETNLDDAVSFTKGCYVGQEIIIRIKHRGHVAKKFAGIMMDEVAEVQRDAPIVAADGKEVGRVTSAGHSPALDRTLLLGYVKYDYLAPGTRVSAATGDKIVRAKIVELPFVRGSWYTD